MGKWHIECENEENLENVWNADHSPITASISSAVLGEPADRFTGSPSVDSWPLG